MALWGRVIQRLLLALYRQRIVLLLVLLIVASAGTYYLWLSHTNLPNEAAAAGTRPSKSPSPTCRGRPTTPR